MLDSITLNNFRGMNRVSDKANMSPDFAWNISNGYIKKDIKSGLGIIKQRLGSVKFNDDVIPEMIDSENVAPNPDLETWTGLTDLLTNGNMETASPPSSWTPFGAGATWAREATIIKEGTYSGKLTRAGTDCQVYQQVSSPSTYSGKTVVLGAWVYATVASRARLSIYFTGTTPASGISYSSYHTGDSTWQYLTVTVTLGTVLTLLQISLFCDTGDTSVYFDSVKLYEQLAPTGWTLSGAGATVAREESTIKVGSYSAKLTRAGNDAQIYQSVRAALGGDAAIGKSVTFGAWAYATVANRVRIHIHDVGGTGVNYSSYHSGVAGWEYLTVTVTIGAGNSQINIGCDIQTGDTTAYFDDMSVTYLVEAFGANQEVKYLFEPKWNAGGVDLVIRAGTAWGIYDGVSGFEVLDGGRSDGSRGMATMFDNQMIMVDGGKARKCTAAYAVSDLSSDAAMPAKSSAVHTHQHKVWLNDDDNPMRACYSKTDSANAADSWSASGDAGYIDFSKILPVGDRLIGFKTFGEAFLCFIFTRCVVVYNCGADPTNFAIQQIIPINCVSGHALSIIGNDFAVCSQEGVNSFKSSMTNQDLDIDDLSKYIQPLYEGLVTPMADKSAISSAFSHRLNHLYICIPGSEHIVLVYSLDIQNFVGVWFGFPCYSILERQDGSVLVGGDGYVYEINNGTNDDGNTITFSYDFPYLYCGDPNANKNVKQIEGIVRHDGGPNLVINYDFGTDELSAAPQSIPITFSSSGVLWDSDEAVWDSASWAGGDIERFLTSDMTGRGKQVAISIAQSTLDATVEIPYIILRFRKEGIKIR